MSDNPYRSVSDAGSAVYSDVRPSYPPAIVDWLLEPLTEHTTLPRQSHLICPLELPKENQAEENLAEKNLADKKKSNSRASFSPLTIADVGAGTGKLTSLLTNSGHNVWAIEPAVAMREEFIRALPNFPRGHLIHSSAEQTLLPDSCCDAVLYAQSWHWVDCAAASQEALRILKPHGIIGIVYNQLAVEIPWVHRLSRIMRSGDVARAHKLPQLSADFSSPEFFGTDWEDVVTPEHIIRLGTTRASWIKQRAEGRAWLTGNLLWYLYDYLGFAPEQNIALPYHTYAWRARVV